MLLRVSFKMGLKYHMYSFFLFECSGKLLVFLQICLNLEVWIVKGKTRMISSLKYSYPSGWLQAHTYTYCVSVCINRRLRQLLLSARDYVKSEILFKVRQIFTRSYNWKMIAKLQE